MTDLNKPSELVTTPTARQGASPAAPLWSVEAGLNAGAAHAASEQTAALGTQEATLGYGADPVCRRINVEIPRDSFTVIVGPNACGKSTLLRTFARLLTPTEGSVLLDGRDLHRLSAKQMATRLGLLPQTSVAPDGITVGDLVIRGRYPHQSFLRQWTPTDEQAVIDALQATECLDLSARPVDSLSGGQRQRVWVAMLLAQQTSVLLLDEPTTYLDLPHQLDLLDLFAELHRGGKTIVAVLHEINHAARYATHLIAMRAGEPVAVGPPGQILDQKLMREVFDLDSMVIPDPAVGTPMVVPLPRSRAREVSGPHARQAD